MIKGVSRHKGVSLQQFRWFGHVFYSPTRHEVRGLLDGFPDLFNFRRKFRNIAQKVLMEDPIQHEQSKQADAKSTQGWSSCQYLTQYWSLKVSLAGEFIQLSDVLPPQLVYIKAGWVTISGRLAGGKVPPYDINLYFMHMINNIISLRCWIKIEKNNLTTPPSKSPGGGAEVCWRRSTGNMRIYT